MEQYDVCFYSIDENRSLFYIVTGAHYIISLIY